MHGFLFIRAVPIREIRTFFYIMMWPTFDIRKEVNEMPSKR